MNVRYYCKLFDLIKADFGKNDKNFKKKGDF